MNTGNGKSSFSILAFVVISVAVVGYFVGLQSPMNPALQTHGVRPDRQSTPGAKIGIDETGWSATDYADMPRMTSQRAKAWLTSLVDLKSLIDPMADIVITLEQKAFALAIREQNRAFNGAPPTIPHTIDQMSSKSCMACHESGIAMTTLRISRMSHKYLENCTQCHVENNPQHMPASLFRENNFVGLPAPTGGPRAYEGAPPMIPHSTWMRIDCMSCHGLYGPHGIRTTHPWRQNCQQCHAPSSVLEQVQLDSRTQFLAPMEIEN